ncbi:hypothetical protein H6H02_09225 [Coleofasciculus sp. FACHB-1120]|nr:hypothetical protein [Coleofasciculus sp. FACHB-1120]
MGKEKLPTPTIEGNREAVIHYMTIMTSNRETLETLRVAKEFADMYGVERLDYLMKFAEIAQNPPESKQSPANANADQILQAVEAVGIELNPWLEDLIISSSVEVVWDAIAVLKAYRQRGMLVRNPEGLLVEAIRNRWKPDLAA